MTRASIKRVGICLDHRLQLMFADGAEDLIELSGHIRWPGVFAAIKDPEAFRGVFIGERGRYLEWTGEIDLCADALRMQLELPQLCLPRQASDDSRSRSRPEAEAGGKRLITVELHAFWGCSIHAIPGNPGSYGAAPFCNLR